MASPPLRSAATAPTEAAPAGARLRRLLSGLLALALACSPQDQPSAESATLLEVEGTPAAESATLEGTPAALEGTPAVRIEGQTITVAELDEQIKEQLFRRASAGRNPVKLDELRREAVESLVRDHLLEVAAAERGLPPEELLEEVTKAGDGVSDEEIETFFAENEASLGERGLEEVREKIRAHLEQRGHAERQREFLAGLREAADVEVFLVTPRFAVEPSGPSRGRPDAPVTIVEFSDYQCPYCKNAEPVVRELLERFPEDVRYVYRHFPMEPVHPEARGASEAAVCADEQDRFWDYHDLLFVRAPDLGSSVLSNYAQELGLDVGAFESCIGDERAKQRVEQDVADGHAVGVNGTPTFFVNGIMLAGWRPIEDFVRIIESELTAEGPAS